MTEGQLTMALVISEHDLYRRQEIVTVIDGMALQDGEGGVLLAGTGIGTAMVLRPGGTSIESAMKKSPFKSLLLYPCLLGYCRRLRRSMVSGIHDKVDDSKLTASFGSKGPVFRADDLMNTFRNAVIPSTNARPRTPPPPVPGGPPRGGEQFFFHIRA